MPYFLPRAARGALGIQYGLLAGAGGWLMSGPTTMLKTAMGQVVYGWAAFLLVGGILCMVGVVTRIWLGEFTGLVLLFFANCMWGGVLVWQDWHTPGPGTSAKYGMALFAWAFGFAYRWLEIRRKVRRAVEAEQDRAEHEQVDGGEDG